MRRPWSFGWKTSLRNSSLYKTHTEEVDGHTIMVSVYTNVYDDDYSGSISAKSPSDTS